MCAWQGMVGRAGRGARLLASGITPRRLAWAGAFSVAAATGYAAAAAGTSRDASDLVEALQKAEETLSQAREPMNLGINLLLSCTWITQKDEIAEMIKSRKIRGVAESDILLLCLALQTVNKSVADHFVDTGTGGLLTHACQLGYSTLVGHLLMWEYGLGRSGYSLTLDDETLALAHTTAMTSGCTECVALLERYRDKKHGPSNRLE
jgi:hypothetical protein